GGQGREVTAAPAPLHTGGGRATLSWRRAAPIAAAQRSRPMTGPTRRAHRHDHAFADFNPLVREGLTVLSRRNMLKASLAGLAGLTVPDLLRRRAAAKEAGHSANDRKSVILLWMAGGPSHIDTWDPKPDRPVENRGPFGVTRTKLPGVVVCEHL